MVRLEEERGGREARLSARLLLLSPARQAPPALLAALLPRCLPEI